VHDHAAAHDGDNPTRVPDVRERIAVEQHEVGIPCRRRRFPRDPRCLADRQASAVADFNAAAGVSPAAKVQFQLAMEARARHHELLRRVGAGHDPAAQLSIALDEALKYRGVCA
jgi:hypothetical protein